jgi:hypothetical protein
MWKEAARPCDRAKRADRKEALNEDNSSNQRVAIAAVALSRAQLPTVASSHHEPDHRLSKPASTVGHGGLW